jgi:hypothetical protein
MSVLVHPRSQMCHSETVREAAPVWGQGVWGLAMLYYDPKINKQATITTAERHSRLWFHFNFCGLLLPWSPLEFPRSLWTLVTMYCALGVLASGLWKVTGCLLPVTKLLRDRDLMFPLNSSCLYTPNLHTVGTQNMATSVSSNGGVRSWCQPAQ